MRYANRGDFYLKHNYAVVLVAFAVLASLFQNCGGAAVIDPRTGSQTSFTTVSETDASETTMMLNIFAAPAAPSSADQNAVCNLIGDATLPLVTHYPMLGLKVQPPIANINQASEYASGIQYVSLYDVSKFALPVVGNYLANRYDLANYPPTVDVNQSRFTGLLNQLCVNDLKSVRFLQGANEVRSAGDLSALVVQNAPYFQIIHSIVFKNNLFTIVVPPRWSKASSGALPTLFNGFYDLNTNLVALEGQSMLETLAQAYVAKGRSGFALMWNGNGGVGSRTVDNVAYGELNDFLKIYLTDLGASPTKLVSFGASRGGISALNVASHPALTAAKVAFAYASVPPNELNIISDLITPTVPALLYASDWSVGFIGSWQKSFRHPAGFTRIGFEGLGGSAAHLKVLTGSSSISDAPGQYNALTKSKVAKLIKNETQVFLETSSHDFIVPSTDQMRLIQDAIASGVRLEGRVNYLLGHGHDNNARRAKLAAVFNSLIDNSITAQFIVSGRISRYVASPNGLFQALSTPTPPLTVELPRYIVDESDPMFLATGPANARYLVVLAKEDKLIKIDLNLDAKGFANLRLNHSLFTAGDYSLFGVYTRYTDGTLKDKVAMTATVKRGLVISRVPGDIRAYVANASGSVIDGINSQGRYFDDGVGYGSNYGFLQTGTVAIPSDELAQLVYEAPASMPKFSCTVSSANLAMFTMDGAILPASEDLGKIGYYYVAGYDVVRNEWWSFDGKNWARHNNSNATYLPISGVTAQPLQAVGIRGSIFSSMDLTQFAGGKIYLGYGLGVTQMDAWNQLINSKRYGLCATLPSN